MKDKYDLQIEELTEHPDRIESQWQEGKGLFKFVTAGLCLTMIRAYAGELFSSKLDFVKEIAADKRLPKGLSGINIKNLHVFAEHQRKIDHIKTIEHV